MGPLFDIGVIFLAEWDLSFWLLRGGFNLILFGCPFSSNLTLLAGTLGVLGGLI